MSEFIPLLNLSDKYIDGLLISRTSNTVVGIAAGQCRDSTNVHDIVVNVALAASTAFNGANGLDTGTVANNTLYAVYVIFDPSNQVPVASLLSLSATQPTMPAVRGVVYQSFRRIGWVKTDSSAHIQDFYIVGTGKERVVTYNLSKADSIVLSAGAATSFTAVSLLANFVPSTSRRALLDYSFLPGAASRTLILRPTGSTLASTDCSDVVTGQVTSVAISGQLLMQTGPAQTVDYIVSNSGDAATLYLKSYTDFL